MQKDSTHQIQINFSVQCANNNNTIFTLKVSESLKVNSRRLNCQQYQGNQ